MKKKEKAEKKENVVKKEEKKEVLCSIFSGSRCSICGTYIGEVDNFCNGGHEVGQYYKI